MPGSTENKRQYRVLGRVRDCGVGFGPGRVPVRGLVAVVALVMCVCQPAAAQDPVHVPVVALDAGHGGTDQGARLPGDRLEKHLALDLVRAMEDDLKARAADRVKVVFTRTGDRDMSVFDRAGRANQARADLFVSLHAAGGWIPGRRAVTVFFVDGDYYEAQAGRAGSWDLLGAGHLAGSRALAQAVRNRLTEALPGVPVYLADSRLPLLAGVDAPGVLVEVSDALFVAEGQGTTQAVARAVARAMVDVLEPHTGN